MASGGLEKGRSLQAVIPGGSSAKVLRADERFKGKLKDGSEFDWGINDIPLDFRRPMAAGSMSGSGGIIVMDDTVDMVEAMANANAFYARRVLWPMHTLSGRGLVDEKDPVKECAGKPVKKILICCFRLPTKSRAAPFARLVRPRPGPRKVLSPSLRMISLGRQRSPRRKNHPFN